jgi:iron complex outermembrane recepter protein
MFRFFSILIFVFILAINSIAQNVSDTTPVIISAFQFNIKRTNLPIAIGKVSNNVLKTINPIQWGDALNTISGVQFINLGNEQHALAIRQPISFKSFFSFTENGIPIRPAGIFNNNALLEIHNADINSIDIIKGTASALYGSDAIGGVVNFITESPFANSNNLFAKIQTTHNGLTRFDVTKKLTLNKKNSFLVSASVASRSNFPIAHYDYNKQSMAISHAAVFNKYMQLTTRLMLLNYKSDMIDSKDSAAFFNKDFSSKHTFTYRAVKALRLTSTLKYNKGDKEVAAFVSFRNNTQTQNPSYLVSEAVWTGGSPLKAHGEINIQKFTSIVTGLNIKKNINNGYFLYGLSTDFTPTSFSRNYIDINKDAQGNYINFLKTDSFIAKTNHNIYNVGGYFQYHKKLNKTLLIDGGLRMDAIGYVNTKVQNVQQKKFNYLAASPRIGIVHTLPKITWYANIGSGFAPPHITDLYGTALPINLKPANFLNYEIGTWYKSKNAKFYAELNAYYLLGKNEIVYTLRNNVLQTINAGRTSHTGIEYNIQYNALKHFKFLLTGSIAKHKYLNYEDEGKIFNGFEMPWASSHTTYLSISHLGYLGKNKLTSMLILNRVGKYFLDDVNTILYNGHTLCNLNFNYEFTKTKMAIFAQAYNVFNKHFAVLAYKGKYGYGYNLGEPFTLNFGVQVRVP